MCRLFGFRSVIQSQVHRSLVSADNAIAVQSEHHPDGWGVAYYVADAPHVIKSGRSAMTDSLFRRVSGIVSSETVLAHVRRATQGELSSVNSHPFQHGRWVMAHNGDIPGFGEAAPALRGQVDPKLRRFILGDTDSEVFFYLILSWLSRTADPHARGISVHTVVDAIRLAAGTIRSVMGEPPSPDRRPLLTTILTNGELMVAYHGGKELFFSTHKRRCPDRAHCAWFAERCEAPSRDGEVNHFIVSSEPLQGENVWNELREGDVVAVDYDMRLCTFPAASEAAAA